MMILNRSDRFAPLYEWRVIRYLRIVGPHDSVFESCRKEFPHQILRREVEPGLGVPKARHQHVVVPAEARYLRIDILRLARI